MGPSKLTGRPARLLLLAGLLRESCRDSLAGEDSWESEHSFWHIHPPRPTQTVTHQPIFINQL